LFGAYQAEFKLQSELSLIGQSFRYTYMHIFSSGNALKLTSGNLELKNFSGEFPGRPPQGEGGKKRGIRGRRKRGGRRRDGEVASLEFDPLGGLGPLNSIILSIY
jgi:hypothetical protein